MSNEYFSVNVGFQTEVLLGHRLHLDGLLASRIFDKLILEGIDTATAIERAHTEIPLARRDGIYAGSALIMPYSQSRRVTIFGSFHREMLLTENPETFIKSEPKLTKAGILKKGSRQFGKIEAGRGPYVNISSAYNSFNLDSVWFVGYGDMSAVESLLKDMRFMGAQRGVGKGKVRHIIIESINKALALPAMVDEEGNVLRALPKRIVDMWTDNADIIKGHTTHSFSLGVRASVSHEAWQPPYRKAKKEMCYTPRSRVWEFDDIQRLVA